MFYGEQINYSIREYSEEAPNGKVVDNYSVRISKKDIYNDETRFGMINSMMVKIKTIKIIVIDIFLINFILIE